MTTDNEIAGCTVVSHVTAEELNGRKLTDFRSHHGDFIKWCFLRGKNPQKHEGYAESTVRAASSRVEKFYRWVWSEEGRYTTRVTTDHADEYMDVVAFSDHSNYSKDNTRKALLMLFKWLSHEHDGQLWDPQITFTDPFSPTNPRDFLSKRERRLIKEASLEYESVPSWFSLNSEQRDEWKTYLAQRLRKPKNQITKEDFNVGGYKVPSLVYVSMDTGLRPIEIERSHLGWIDLHNQILRIPANESSKNTEYWTPAFTDRTRDLLEAWLEERRLDEKYDGSDTIWLTQYGNPYTTQSLRQTLHKLCEIAGISLEGRSMSWYTIRHSLGSAMAESSSLSTVAAQMRHRSVVTTQRYDQSPPDARRRTLEKID